MQSWKHRQDRHFTLYSHHPPRVDTTARPMNSKRPPRRFLKSSSARVERVQRSQPEIVDSPFGTPVKAHARPHGPHPQNSARPSDHCQTVVRFARAKAFKTPPEVVFTLRRKIVKHGKQRQIESRASSGPEGHAAKIPLRQSRASANIGGVSVQDFISCCAIHLAQPKIFFNTV